MTPRLPLFDAAGPIRQRKRHASALRALAKHPGALYVGSARRFRRSPGVAKMSRI
jgi:hypothetical protein